MPKNALRLLILGSILLGLIIVFLSKEVKALPIGLVIPFVDPPPIYSCASNKEVDVACQEAVNKLTFIENLVASFYKPLGYTVVWEEKVTSDVISFDIQIYYFACATAKGKVAV